MSAFLKNNTQTDINSEDNGKTALHVAVERYDLRSIRNLLSQGANVNARDNDNRTPLHIAAVKNFDESYFKVVEILLQNGADPNARDNRNQTPLFIFVKKCTVKIVQLLLNFHADINVIDNNQETLLFYATCNNRDFKVLDVLVNQGLDVNHRNNSQRTPLHAVCSDLEISIGYLKKIKCLLKHGANMNAMDDGGYKPSLIAVMYCNYGVHKTATEFNRKNIDFLIEHTGFNLIQKNKHFLSFKYMPGQDYLWKLILEHIAKLDSLNITVHSAILDMILISKKEIYNKYFNECKEELLRAKSSNLENSWITYYNLLVDGRRKLKNYAGNEDLVGDFEKSDFEMKFPIYGTLMSEKFKKGIKRRELFDKSSIKLSDCLPIFSPNHLIVREILDCVLSKKDLSKFCK